MPTPFFDFGDDKISKTKNVKIYPMVKDFNKKVTNNKNTTSVTWAGIVTNEKPNTKKTYLYDHEVDQLLSKMNWGDFECMMDDVIIVPSGKPKPKI